MSTKPSSFLSPSVARSYDLAHLLAPVKEEMLLVEKWLNSNLLADPNTLVDQLLKEVFQPAGKRLRPALVLLTGKATAGGGEIGRLFIILAVLTELIHAASLVHDDVIDAASTRRGQETVNSRWSDKLAVLTGDLLFAQASICLSRLMNPEIVGIYGQVLGDLCTGEIRQMQHQFVIHVDWESYIQKSVWKTASLFQAGCQSAAILNACSDAVIAGLKNYGLNLGICFQIVDDCLDVIGDASVLGKAAGSDLAQGLITAPTMFVLQKQDHKAQKLEQLIKTRAVQIPEGIAEALAIIQDTGAVEATLNLAYKYAKLAQDSLAILPDSQYRNCLDALASWLVTRTK